MLVLLLLVLIVVLFVLVALLVLILVFVLIVLIVLILIFVLVVVLHNEHSFFDIFGLHTHYATHYADLCVPRLLDCHARWSSNAYRKDANVMVEAITIGTLIHQSQGAST